MAVSRTEAVKIDNIEIDVYEPPEIDDWIHLSTDAKIAISEESGAIQSITARNTTTEEMHEWSVGKIDPNGSDLPEMIELAVGRSDTTPSESDTSLNDEVDRAPITSTERDTDTLTVRVFLDKGVGNVDTANGESLSEVGLYAEDYFLNHAILTNDIDKTSNKTARIDVLITYDAA